MWVQAGADVPGLSAASPGTTGRQDGRAGGSWRHLRLIRFAPVLSIDRLGRGYPLSGGFPGNA